MTQRIALSLAVPLLLLAAAPSRAQDACATAVTQADLNQCSADGWKAADKALNLAYAGAVDAARSFDGGSGGGTLEGLLRTAQRAWIGYRDAACAAEAGTWEGGSGQPMILYGCLERLTRQRTDDLHNFGTQE